MRFKEFEGFVMGKKIVILCTVLLSVQTSLPVTSGRFSLFFKFSNFEPGFCVFNHYYLTDT